MQLQGKTALITGGTSGLGLSLAKKLLEKGSTVYILGRHQEKLNDALTTLNSKNALPILADVTNYNELQEELHSIPVDILINNAGVWLEGTIDQHTAEEISQTINSNLTGVIFVTKVVLPTMLQQESGYIFNIVSTSGLKGREEQSVYVASKFGVSGFTKSLELDLAKTNIKVTGFYPGGMNTQLFAKAGNPKENSDWMNTDKVADVITFLLEQDNTMVVSSLELNKRGTKNSNK